MPPRRRDGKSAGRAAAAAEPEDSDVLNVAMEERGAASKVSLKRGLKDGLAAQTSPGQPSIRRRTSAQIDKPDAPDTRRQFKAAAVQGADMKGRVQAASLDPDAADSPYESVVKVFAIHCEPNFSSSGFIITGRRILTNAHCVADHTQVKVKRRGSDMKYVAQVLATATEGDMALLTVEDEDFWKGSEPVQFGSLPQLQDAVAVVGYPIGGDTMSVTSGVVSRIEVTSYVHGSAELLGIQIDAAINSGNSGGPAFNEEGQCVGIAFQSLKHEDAENIGYIIPTPVVWHFIQDYEKNGRYTGFPCLGIEWQKLENPDLRKVLNMSTDQKGVMVRRIDPTSAAFKILEHNDVLLSFDGVPIANDGTVPFRSGERIGYSYLISQKYVDEEASLQVLKKGKEVTIKIKLQAPVRLVPFHTNGLPPSYFIVAGLVFTAVTVPYLRSEYGKEYDFDAPVRLLEKLMHSMAETEGQQVVVLSQVLAAEINIGYEDIINTQVATVNGHKINSLKDLVNIVDSCSDPYLDLDLDYRQKVVLHTQRAKQATGEILAMHRISHDRSNDMLVVAEGVEAPDVQAPVSEEVQPQGRQPSGRLRK